VQLDHKVLSDNPDLLVNEAQLDCPVLQQLKAVLVQLAL